MKCLLRFYWSYRRQIKVLFIVFVALLLFVIANIVFRFIDDASSGNNLSDTDKQASAAIETGNPSTSTEETAQSVEQAEDVGGYGHDEAVSQANVTTVVPGNNNLLAQSTASDLKPSSTPAASVSYIPSTGYNGTKSTALTPKPSSTPVVSVRASSSAGKVRTKTSTSTPKPSSVRVVSVIPSPSAGSSGTKSAGTLGVQFANSNTAKSTNTVSFRIKLTNTGTTSVKLSDIKLRYYYSVDGDTKQNFWCDWSSAGSGNVNGKFVRMSSASNKADYYLEIGFTDGAKSLEPGEAAEVQARFAKDGWSGYDQSDDYSFYASGNGYTNWNKITMYISGKLKYGVEP